jgi:predicted alpha/beta superfamily hydrolase
MACNYFHLVRSAEGSALLELDASPRLTRHAKFRSRFLAEARDIIVYVPEEYGSDPCRRYPVFYLQDGQNLFDPATAYVPGNDWRVDKTADDLIEQHRTEPIIIVGIYNTGEHRIDEYTPTPDATLGGGQAGLYGRMLVEEIKPFIEAHYRTMTDPLNTAIGGSSLGGLVSLYLGFAYPDVFGKVAALSPSVWWNNKAILDIVRNMRPKPRLKIWLDIGSSEKPGAVRDAETMRDLLVDRGWQLGDDLHYVEAEGAQHNEAAWADRIGSVLEFLFPASI